MSDFDDEPIEGSRSTGDGDEPDARRTRPSRRPADEARDRPARSKRPRPRDEDDWDDEVDEPIAPVAKKRRARDEDEDDWDDEPVRAPRSGRQKAARPVEEDDDWDDDWDDDDEGGGRRDLTMVFAIAAAVLVIALVIVLTRPKDDDGDDAANNQNTPEQTATSEGEQAPQTNWQGPVADAVGEIQGRIDGEQGVFIWTDFTGWHIRNTSGQEVSVVVAAESVVEKDASDAPKGDPSTELTVAVPSGDGATGIDLDLGASTTADFTVSQGETAIPADQIKLGGKDGVADANPVKFEKK